MSSRTLFVAGLIFLASLASLVDRVAAQNVITAGAFPAGAYQWRIDTDPSTGAYEIVRRVTGAANSTFDIDVKMAAVPASPPAREFLFQIYFDNTIIGFDSVVAYVPGLAAPAAAFIDPASSGTAGNVTWVGFEIISDFTCGGYAGEFTVVRLRFKNLGVTGVSGLDVGYIGLYTGNPQCGAPIGDTTANAKAVIVVDPNGASNLSALTVNNNGNGMSINAGLRNPDADGALGIANITLRSALQVANAPPFGNNRITFWLNPGAATITNPLMPQLTDTFGVHVDGTTQPGAGVEVKGPAGATMGFDLASANNIIEDLTINRFTGAGNAGVRINGNNNIVRGCRIGTNTAANAAIANNVGILVTGGTGNQIGGAAAANSNVISGNAADGVMLSGGTGTTIRGNKIGTDVTGALPLANVARGVFINGVANNTIGAAGALGRNVISGNGSHGVEITGAGASGNLLLNNYIGTNLAGAGAVPNNQHGVYLNNAPNNTIGGALAADWNLISGNGVAPAIGHGIWIDLAGSNGNIVRNNHIGLNAAGLGKIPNLNDGIRISGGAHDNTIGGALGNYISGNAADGVHIRNPATFGNNVFNNGIGVNINGIGGTLMGNGGNGVQIAAVLYDNHIGGNFDVIGNSICNNVGDGILLNNALVNEIRGNSIGQNFAGVDQPNTGNGINMIAASFDNTVVGNSIYANLLNGVRISGAGTDQNDVLQNFIGAAAHGNGLDGVVINLGAQNNLISVNDIGNNGTPNGAGSGNGIQLANAGTAGNLITANQLLGNLGAGVLIFAGANLNVIGGDIPAAANIVDGSLNHGVQVVLGFDNSIRGNIIRFNNFSGVNVIDGTGNEISRNSIFSNNAVAGIGGLGIDLNLPLGVTMNDAGDPDGGGNVSQNTPVLTGAAGGMIVGTLNSLANRSYRLEFFSNQACDGSGFGEGETYLGAMNVVTNAQGDAAFNFIAVPAPPAGLFITATATDITPNPLAPANNTSEFCACIQHLAGAPPCVADINGDGVVNSGDMLAVINAWGACPAPPAGCPADIAPPGGNGQVNAADLLVVINAWGPCP